MGKGLLVLGLLPLLVACGKTERSHQLAVAPDFDSGGRPGFDSHPRDDAFGGEDWMPDSLDEDEDEDAVAVEKCTTEPQPGPQERLPPSSPLITGAATVHAVSTNALELETALGLSYFGWVGPPLTGYFVPGEKVEVSTFRNWGEPEDDWHIVESDSFMIATMVGRWNAPLSPDPGWRAGPSSPTGLPELAFVNAGCCQRDDVYECDYSNLLVVFYPANTLITQGSTETFGSWTITNLGARTQGEWEFSLGVTIFGPARHLK